MEPNIATVDCDVQQQRFIRLGEHAYASLRLARFAPAFGSAKSTQSYDTYARSI
jgi:hypothetical protein